MGVNQMDSQLLIQSLVWNTNKMHDYKWGNALCSFLHGFWFIVWKWLLCSQIWTNHSTTCYNRHVNTLQEWFYRQYWHFCKKKDFERVKLLWLFSVSSTRNLRSFFCVCLSMVKSAGILYLWLYSFNWCSCKWNSTVKKPRDLGSHRSKNEDYSFWVWNCVVW